MKKKKETPNPTPDTGKGPLRCSKRWRQNEPLSRPARSPTSASGGAQGRKLSPPGTVVDVQQNVAAQRGGSENAKESPHLQQGEAEPAESQARPGGGGAEIRPYISPRAPYQAQESATYTVGAQITAITAKGLQPTESSRDYQMLRMEQGP